MTMNTSKLRVIQWGTGNVGKHALRHILSHPQMELVGLRVYSEAKVGLDAGRLCDQPDCGVLATNDPETLRDVAADCVVFMGQDSLISDPRAAGSQAHGLVGVCE